MIRIIFHAIIYSVIAALTLTMPASTSAAETDNSYPAELLKYPEVIAWLRKDMSDTDIAALKMHDLHISGDVCSCSDATPHYPYAVLRISSKTSSLIARIEGNEVGFRIRPIAIQKGKHYFLHGADEKSFGEYDSTCDFTDARFGPTLAPFFPDCKDDKGSTD